jgi:hypothetical protein
MAVSSGNLSLWSFGPEQGGTMPVKMMAPKKMTVELYYDPAGMKSGKFGCWRARVADNHDIHEAASEKSTALQEIILSMKIFEVLPTEHVVVKFLSQCGCKPPPSEILIPIVDGQTPNIAWLDHPIDR